MNWRKTHRYVALFSTLPLIIVALSGVVLQLRNQFEWIQPSSLSAELKRGSRFLTLEEILQTQDEKQVDQIIFRPTKNNLTLRMKDGTDIQMNPSTGEVLKKAQRRTTFFIELHQGSWLGPYGQYLLYFPAALGLCYLILSGLMIYPFKKRDFHG